MLPEEAEVLRAAQESLLEEMRRWGYRHVITPMVESIDVLELGLNAEQRRKLLKFSDARGEVVALVGERTIPVARLVAGTGTDGDDLAFLGLLLGGIRNDDAAGGAVVRLDPADNHAVVQWTEFHECFLLWSVAMEIRSPGFSTHRMRVLAGSPPRL